MRALEARRVALLTPYVAELAERNRRLLEADAGVEVVAHETMGLTHDHFTDKVSKELRGQ